jgi:hypothetical protein
VRTPVDWSVDRVRSTDSMLVRQDRRRWRQVIAFDLGLFLGAVAAWSLYPVTRGTWFGIAGGVLIGLQLGRASIGGIRRASAYRSGWLSGRQAMVAAMAEAYQRGMTLEQWLTAELSRDYAVLGLTADDVARDLDPPEDSPGP